MQTSCSHRWVATVITTDHHGEVDQEFHAFDSCEGVAEFCEAAEDEDGTLAIQVMGSRVEHFARWIAKDKDRFDEIDPADPEVLKHLRGENDQP